MVEGAQKMMPKRKLMVIAFICESLCQILIGPSKLLGLPDLLWIIVVGNAMNQFLFAFAFIPTCPEMVEATQLRYQSTHPRLNDLTSGIFNVFFGIGSLLGPQMSTIFMSWYGYRTSCDIFMCICFVLSIIYVLMLVLYPCKENR